MIAGLPGTGLGGIFYIASALLMPVHRALRGGGHPGRSWPRVMGQVGIALGIMGALFLTGWALGLLLPTAQPVAGEASVRGASTYGMVRWLAVVGTAGLLAALLALVELAGLLVRRRPRRVAGTAPRQVPPYVRQERRRARTPAPSQEAEAA